MREFDLNGIRVAEFQAKIFEKSIDLDCSSAIFIRRFYYSNLLEQLDKNDPSILSYDVIEALNDIEQQFGPTKYGKIKESGEALFWLGYLYRYISYTRNVSTKFLFKTFNYKELLPLYYVYHTQDMEWCVKSLLEKYEIDEKYFDPNERFKRAMKLVRIN